VAVHLTVEEGSSDKHLFVTSSGKLEETRKNASEQLIFIKPNKGAVEAEDFFWI